MSKIKVTVETEAKTVKATGVEPGMLRVSVKDAEGNVLHEQDVEGKVAEFSGVANGEYLITAVRLASNGTMIGGMASQRITIAVDELVEYDEPVGFSVEVQEE